jgi:TolA-binding protein
MELRRLLRDFKKFTAAAVICASVFMYAAASESASSAFVEACKSYSRGEWADAKFQLKKAVSYKENLNPDTYFMLIMAEVYDGDNKSALDDCNFYLENFSDSMYYSRVYYQKGKLLYSLGEYEKSIVVLSDFCHRYEKDELYSYALFYIGESLFAGYKYDEAGSVYERIVTEFPESPKTPAAQYRLETILQRGREEKLLYLLKQTGEEYLSAKEEYERQLKMYNLDAVERTRQKLAEAQQENENLQRQIRDLEGQLQMLKDSKAYSASSYNSVSYKDGVDVPNAEPYNETRDQVRLLRKKAIDAQKRLSEQDEEVEEY